MNSGIGKREIRRIQSFTVDHDLLEPGLYVSRRDGDVTTYDLRTRKPNSGSYMDNVTMHTVEHMFATLIRNSELGDRVLYFGPMGCRTGFYLLMRDTPDLEVYRLIISVLNELLQYDGPVFGAHRKECGNYRSLDLKKAKQECSAYLKVLERAVPDFAYREAAK